LITAGFFAILIELEFNEMGSWDADYAQN